MKNLAIRETYAGTGTTVGVNVGRVRLLLASLERKDGRAGVGVEGGLLSGLPSLSGSDSL